MAPIFWVITGEHKSVFAVIESRADGWFQLDAFVAVALSCVFGLLISFFGFAARQAVSATAFTVTGVQSVTTKGSSAGQREPVSEEPKEGNGSEEYDEEKQSLVSSAK
nr:unnamed protein product [Digitaria exilis]